jgi:hypothetical protein
MQANPSERLPAICRISLGRASRKFIRNPTVAAGISGAEADDERVDAALETVR